MVAHNLCYNWLVWYHLVCWWLFSAFCHKNCFNDILENSIKHFSHSVILLQDWINWWTVGEDVRPSSPCGQEDGHYYGIAGLRWLWNYRLCKCARKDKRSWKKGCLVLSINQTHSTETGIHFGSLAIHGPLAPCLKRNLAYWPWKHTLISCSLGD